MAATEKIPVLLTRTGELEDQSAIPTGATKWLNTGWEMLDMRNASGRVVTVTIPYARNPLVDGQSCPSPTIVMQPNTSYFAGPFPPELYNDSNGYVTATYDNSSSVSDFIWRFPMPQEAYRPLP